MEGKSMDEIKEENGTKEWKEIKGRKEWRKKRN